MWGNNSLPFVYATLNPCFGEAQETARINDIHKPTITITAAMALLAFGIGAMGPLAASADDHLFNGANADGADNRGFGNPVAKNRSGTSGAAAQPGSVPGLGNPNAGEDQGTPSFDPESRDERVEDKSQKP